MKVPADLTSSEDLLHGSQTVVLLYSHRVETVREIPRVPFIRD